MAAKAIKVELLKQIIRLKQDGFSVSATARLIGVSRPTVIKYLSRFKQHLAEDGSFEKQDVASLYELDM